MYKLIFEDSKGRTTCEYETQNIFNIDSFTGEYANKEELLQVKTEKGKTAYVCTVCGYVYYSWLL